MRTRFSLELVLDKTEQLHLRQMLEFLEARAKGTASLPAELAHYLANSVPDNTSPEDRIAELIGTDTIGIEVVTLDTQRVRIFDSAGVPNLPMLCQIIANVLPRLLPLEFTFAMIDEDARYYSGGLVVMSRESAEVQVVDSKLKQRRKKNRFTDAAAIVPPGIDERGINHSFYEGDPPWDGST